MLYKRRNLMLLIVLVFGGSLVIFGLIQRGPLQEQKTTLSRHLKFDSQARKLLAFKEKDNGDLNTYATHSINGNSLLLSDSLKRKGTGNAKPRVKPVRGRFKRQTRRKRDVPKEKYLPWQFNLNISRPDTPNAKSSSEAEIPGPRLRMEKPGRHLSISLHVKGNDLDDTYSELNDAWDSVENFLRQLFGGNTEELSERGHSVFVDFNGLPSKFHTGDFSQKDGADGETLSQQKKDPRFLFDLLGLGSNMQNPPINKESVGALDNITTTDGSPVSDTNTTISKLEVLDDFTHTLPLGESTDESLVSETNTTISNLEVLDDFTQSRPLEESTTSEKFLDMVLKDESTTDDSSTLSTSTIESSNENGVFTPSEQEPNEFALIHDELESHSFTSEHLRELCTHLLQQRRQKIPRHLDEHDFESSGSVSFDENDAVSVESTSLGPIILTESPSEQRQQNIGFISSFLHRITGGRFGQGSSNVNPNSKNDSFEPETQNRNARLLNFNNNIFGSGRPEEELNGFKNIEFSDMDSNPTQNIENGKITVSDCVAFFRRIADENSQTESDVQSSSQAEHTQNAEDLFLFESTSVSHTTTDLQGSGQSVSIIKDLVGNPNTNLLGEKQNQINVFVFGNDINVGSGSPEVPEEKTLGFGDLIGGSGRSEMGHFPIDQNTEDPFTSTDVSQDLRIFSGFLNFGSGGRNIEESTQFQTENTLHSTKDERIFGLLDFGSGVGRTLEKTETPSVDFPTGEILLDEARSAREPSIQDQHNDPDLDITNRKTNVKFATIDERVRTKNPNQERDVYSDVFGSRDAFISDVSDSQQNRHSNEGSGDGIELANVKRTKSGCVVCVVENGTETLIRCTECSSDQETDSEMVNSFESRQMEESSETTPEVIKSVPDPTNGTLIKRSKNENERNESTLIGKLFLNGNDRNDQIDLVPEAESTITPSPGSFSPRNARRGRLLDLDSLDPQEPEHVTDLERNDSFDDSEGLRDSSSDVTSTFGETRILGVDPAPNETFSERVGQAWSDQNDSSVLFFGTKLRIPPNQEISDRQTTYLPLKTAPTKKNRKTSIEKKECFHTDQCSKLLNERCVIKGLMSVCDCSSFFVRDPSTQKCVEPLLIKAQLKFPKEDYHKDFENDSSNRYHRMRKDSLKTIKLLIGYDQDLLDLLVKVDVTDFEEGSLVIDFDLSFLRKYNSTLLEFVGKVEKTLTTAFRDENVTKTMPLKSRNARVLRLSTVSHRCDSKELNYCSPNAKCLPVDAGFKCQCKDGYLDKSREGFAGEVCIEFCPPRYCGENGYCDMRFEGERRCLCYGWYFGERCQISGSLVIGAIASLNVVVLAVLVAIACICRCIRKRRSRCYGNETPLTNGGRTAMSAVPSNLPDAIPMNDMGAGPSSKYVSRSTPMHGLPDIKVTSPSIVGSSISYDFDSTFDRSVNIELEDKSMKL